MSGVNQYGSNLVSTSLVLIGACLFNCCLINEGNRIEIFYLRGRFVFEKLADFTYFVYI